MPTKTPSPVMDKCLEVAGMIVSAAITSGQLSSDIETVIAYMKKLYPQLVELRLKS